MFGIYIHWPYCLKKCPYCAFNSHLIKKNIDFDVWKAAFLQELSYIHQYTHNKHPTSIFFGGGTPSLMPPSLINFILNTIHKLWSCQRNIEISLEANPITCSKELFTNLKSVGINRISLGVQSLNDKTLSFLGRQHTRSIAISAIKNALHTFENVSYDIIYSLPHQTLDSWQKDLQEILHFKPQHLSLYQLTIEEGTPFHKEVSRRQWEPLNATIQAKLLRNTWQLLKCHLFDNYEISNFAQPGYRCKHNYLYWTYDDFIGIGPGAHGRISIKNKKYETKAFKTPEKWLHQALSQTHALEIFSPLQPQDSVIEYLLMSLRIKEGISWDKIEYLGGDSLHNIINVKYLQNLEELHFIKRHQKGFYLTEKARLITDFIAKNLLL